MTFNIDNEINAQFPFDYEQVIKDVVMAALDFEECPYEAEVSVVITNDDEIKLINKENRNIDNSTDVLSFPMAFYEEPADFDALEIQDDVFNPETGEYMLGDIMISADHVFRQAEAYGHSVKREFAFLLAHSMLHLMGYDHMEEKEREIMEDKQEQILSSLGISR